jgi:hypothetical protein
VGSSPAPTKAAGTGTSAGGGVFGCFSSVATEAGSGGCSSGGRDGGGGRSPSTPTDSRGLLSPLFCSPCSTEGWRSYDIVRFVDS